MAKCKTCNKEEQIMLAGPYCDNPGDCKGFKVSFEPSHKTSRGWERRYDGKGEHKSYLNGEEIDRVEPFSFGAWIPKEPPLDPFWQDLEKQYNSKESKLSIADYSNYKIIDEEIGKICAEFYNKGTK